GIGCGVVVQEPDPLVLLRLQRGQVVQGQPHRGGEGGGAADLDDRGVGEGLADQPGGAVLAAGVDGDAAVEGAALTPDTAQDPREPPLPVMADEDGGDDHRGSLTTAPGADGQGSDSALLELAALPLGEPAPDA